MLSLKIMIFVIHFFLCSRTSEAQTWLRVGYYRNGNSEIPIPNINSSLYTHLICGFADVNSYSFQLFLTPEHEKYFSIFTQTVKKKNPSVTTLLSISDPAAMSSIMQSSFSRKSFINSSIETARHYGFQGIDFWWNPQYTGYDMSGMGDLFKEWRAAVVSEARNSSKPQLILTAAVKYSPNFYQDRYPIDSIQKNLNWVHVVTDYYASYQTTNFTTAPAALYNPESSTNTDYGINEWIDSGLPANKLVMCLSFNGQTWKLVNHNDNGIGAPADGPAIVSDGDMTYKEIKNYIEQYGGKVMYNETYVVNYWTKGVNWIGFDDVEAVQAKVLYAKKKGLLGYYVWQVSYDKNWVLSQAAVSAQEGRITISENQGNKDGENKRRRNRMKWKPVVITFSASVVVLLCCASFMYYRRKRRMRNLNSENNSAAGATSGEYINNDPDLIAYSLDVIKAATDEFSPQKKLGVGGYGPVYKGVLSNGQEIAVKKLSNTSNQGLKEFKNEVQVIAKLQHKNVVKLLGSCNEAGEFLLIYEYMPNKSLDYYLFDGVKRLILDLKNRIHIIEGVCQGLVYFHEYSRLTIFHGDLKAANILLDKDMRPKISDFGMARIFPENIVEAQTERFAGTLGYAPPEFVQNGNYSLKSDVYSFGVLLLQIISGKKVSVFHGEDENFSLPAYAYKLWKDGNGLEFVDPFLVDGADSSNRLMRYLQIALLCVQENSEERPTMLRVSSMLQGTDLMPTPNKPAYSNQAEGNGQNEFVAVPNLGMCSVDEATITELECR